MASVYSILGLGGASVWKSLREERVVTNAPPGFLCLGREDKGEETDEGHTDGARDADDAAVFRAVSASC